MKVIVHRTVIRPLSSLRKTALVRKVGYVDACLSLGKVSGEGDSRMVEFSPEVHAKLRQEFALPKKMRLGDLVGKIATPIARAWHLPCIDPKTNDLRPESGCAKRKAALNEIL